MNTADHQIARAIADSIREDRTVAIGAQPGTVHWLDLVRGLHRECDDWTDAEDDAREYWGHTEEGDEWRVHVISEGKS